MIPTSNADFLRALVRGHPGHPWVTSFPEDPGKANGKQWGGWLVRTGTDVPQGNANAYFSVGLLPKDAATRSKDAVTGVFAVVLDDIGADDLEQVPEAPTWALETSPHNYQLGFALEPGQDPQEVDQLVRALTAGGYSAADKSGNNVVRYVRLPNGLNNKQRVVADTGCPFPCKLDEFHPERRYTVARLAAGFRAEMAAQQPHSDPTTDDELRAQILSCESFHRPLVQLAARLIGRGMPQEDVAAALLNLMDEAAANLPDSKRRQEWEARRASILRYVGSAVEKYHDPRGEAQAQRVEFQEDHPEPQPLPDGLAPVEPFRFELLPDALQSWVQDICERVQCSADYVGVAAITALTAALGRKVAIRPQAQTDWTVVPNQWALIIGRPGVLKSPAMEAALAPLKRLAALACDDHEQAAKDHERGKAVAKLKAAAAEKQAQKLLAKDSRADVAHLLEAEDLEEPVLQRYITNDTTAAALGELLRQNPNGLLVHRDEIVSLLRALDREDNAEARGFYLTAWNGDSAYTFDRITRGMNLHIPAVCLSLLGSTQPGRVAHYIRQAVKGGAGDDGLIQRFGLLVWPDTGGEWKEVDRWPSSEARRQASAAFERLDQLDPAAVGAMQDTGFNGEPDGLPYLRFEEQGLGLFREWRQDLEGKLRGGELHPAVESHLAKYRKLVPGLALLLHLADGHTGPVGRRQVLQALGWAEYLESHAQRAYGAVTTPEVEAAQAVLFRLRRGDLPRSFKGWQVWRPGWAKLTDREVVQDALQLLAELDWLTVERQQTKGRTATVYTVDPRALQ